MVWGNGGCEFLLPVASFMSSTRTEGKALLRRASSSIGTITIQASIGLPGFQNRATDQCDEMIDVLAFKKLFWRVDRSGGKSPIWA